MIIVCHRCWVLNPIRFFVRREDLTRPGVTKFATNYLILKSILEEKPLKDMFEYKN